MINSTWIRPWPLVVILVILLWAPAAGARPREQARASATDSGAASFPGQPAYASLFEKGERLVRRGDWAGGLRLFSRIYGEEVPVDAFYRTLERRILEVLNGLDDKAGFQLGRERYQVGELGVLFQQVLLPQPEVHYSGLDLARDLPLARFIYLCVVAGRPHPRPPANRALAYAMPRLDLDRALASPDPWLVSAALFMARKGLGRFRPRQVIERWQARPDLWDRVCTDQALLFLAGRPRAEVAGLKVGNTMLGRELSRLEALEPGKDCSLQVLFFWMGSLEPDSADYLQAGDCSGLQVVDLARSAAKPAGSCPGGMLRLPPGKYRLEYRSPQAHGAGMAFQCRPGLSVRVVVPVLGHI